MANNPDQAFIEARQAAIEKAINTHAVDSLLSHYIDEGLDYSDYGAGAINMDKAGLTTYFNNMFSGCGNLKVSTVAVSGSKNFTTWEWNLSFNYNTAVEQASGDVDFTPDKADGREVRMVGVTIAWWNEEGMVWKNHDYAKAVESFEGR
ncbi:uncharacterized protein LY89DRAFT_779830 [Mollisia scopiformis]|uniref:SnoaL-like domain-containing protein n=1 Tax=Mollisia scopiformis TaxID=149040 RepID=A0A194XIA5_MOLSC|nr:uncharacterized protein LY89DRAFT_779830 [Mollisia scopiformis]KUJ19955.1 hypothetical protein LY89DRAFT_779830 [Mollisia scopiformis]